MPEKGQPDSLAKMGPLFQAGRRQAALDDVYKDRIRRQNEAYLVKKLGAFGANLGLVASFFDPPFEQPAADLTEDDRAWLLNEAAFNLRALGRLREAVAPMRAVLALDVEEKSWKLAAGSASNLSELQLTLGDVADAQVSGEAAVAHADRSGDAFERMINPSTLADARHQAGDVAAAQQLFEEAEAIQAEIQPDYPRLYSVQGYRYGDLLLTLDQAEKVRERARQTLAWVTQSGLGLLTIAVDHLSLGRAAQALGNRDEAMRIATRSGMRLFKCDAHLEYARLAIKQGQPDTARKHVESAASLVSECGYHRRDGEVEALRKELETTPS